MSYSKDFETLQPTLNDSSHAWKGINAKSIYEIIYNPMDPRFQKSSCDEINGLLTRRFYRVVKKEDIPPDATVLSSRVHHSIKTEESGNKRYKTRLVTRSGKEISRHRSSYSPSIFCSTATDAKSILRF